MSAPIASIHLGASYPTPLFHHHHQQLPSVAVALAPSSAVAPLPRRASSISEYRLIRTLKTSLYGKVKLAEHEDVVTGTRTSVAVKISDLFSVRSSTMLEDPHMETRVLRLLSSAPSTPLPSMPKPFISSLPRGGHPNVMRLLDELQDGATQWQVLELCEKGELFDLLESHGGLGEHSARRYFLQAASGVMHVHAHGWCHLDVSPENMLRDNQENIKIIDFGMARMLPTSGLFRGCGANKPGKVGYMAPEVFAGHEFDGRKADTYSLGVVLFTMLLGVPPYQNPSASDRRFDLIYRGEMATLLNRWKMIDKISKEALDLVQQLMSPPDKRPSLASLATHPWVRGITFEQAQREQEEQTLLQERTKALSLDNANLQLLVDGDETEEQEEEEDDEDVEEEDSIIFDNDTSMCSVESATKAISNEGGSRFKTD